MNTNLKGDYNYSELKKHLNEHGYVIIPNLLSEADIDRCRIAIQNYFDDETNSYICGNGGKSQSDSFSYVEGIQYLLGEEKLINTFNEISGRQMNYLHHCDVHQDRLGSWHKDSTGYIKEQWDQRDGDETFAVYKVAIYLQDHSKDSNGLSIRHKSHLIDDFTSGEQIDLHSKPGDVIFFDQRLTHCGQQFTFSDKVVNRLFKRNQKLRTKVSRRIRKVFGRGNKISIFYGLGAKNEFSKEFSKNIILRQNIQNKVDKYVPHPELIRNLKKSQTPIIDE